MNLFKRLFDKTPEIQFKAVHGNAAVSTSVVPSRIVKAEWMKKQSKEKRYQQCPGMMDYSNAGYIVCAHTDIHIKCNKAGTAVRLEGMQFDKENVERFACQPFDQRLVDGMIEIEDTAKKGAYKIPLPWAIITKPGYSAYVMPALMHFPYEDVIFAYPGIVDYDSFHVINFVFSCRKECEITIPAGTPLLQVLPFKREEINAVCDKATESDFDRYTYCMVSRVKNFYRRFLSSRKKFNMECPYQNIKHKG